MLELKTVRVLSLFLAQKSEPSGGQTVAINSALVRFRKSSQSSNFIIRRRSSSGMESAIYVVGGLTMANSKFTRFDSCAALFFRSL